MQYQNPIRRGMYPDPSVVNVNGTFYMVNSTFEYYPGIALAQSQDLLNWENLPGIATSPQQADLRYAKSNEGIFAANIRYHQGHFYVVTTNFAEFKTIILKGALIKGHLEWDDERAVVDIPGIDPDLFFEDGKTYLQFTGYIDQKGTKAIQQVEINPETGEVLQGPQIISYGTGGRDVEGPHIIKQHDRYYLLLAEGGTGLGHMITILSSDSLWGPFTDSPGVNPLFTNRDRANEPLQCIGHADLFQDCNGAWWLTCLGTRPANIGFSQITNLGRETLLYPVDWSGKWPQIYNGVPTVRVDLAKYPIHSKTLLAAQPDSHFTDDFQKKWKPEWMSLRNQLANKADIEEGDLILKGQNILINQQATPSFLGIRQAEHNEKFTLQLDPDRSRLNQGQAGLIVVINNTHYAGIMLSATADHQVAIHHLQQVSDLQVNEIVGYLPQFPIELSVISTNKTKKFIAASKQHQIHFEVDALNLSNEALAALNTGDFQGPYVTGNAQLAITKAMRCPFKNKEGA